MATSLSPRALIAERRREIEDDMERLRAQIGACQTALETRRKDLTDLDVAERVWSTLEPRNVPSTDEDEDETRESSKKPQGTPHVSHMILAALHEAKRQGIPGLTPKNMVRFIAEHWWPDVTMNDVGPIAWRMWKRQGLLQKNGGSYLLPNADLGQPSQGTIERRPAKSEVAA